MLCGYQAHAPEIAMCRWIAYLGPTIPMGLALVAPRNSLLVQSKYARRSEEPTNGDGFGVGWYSDHQPLPGVYREVRPAWNDENFKAVAWHVRSRLFMAHVRASTGAAVQRSNCHQFQHDRWLFQHNGLVPRFAELRRELMLEVSAEWFNGIQGTTDSELLLFLALSLGLEEDPPGALARMAARVNNALEVRGITDGFHLSAALADGERLWAVRYSSAGEPRTLFYTTEGDALRQYDPSLGALPEGSVMVVSEPLEQAVNWRELPPSSLLTAGPGGCRIGDFRPAGAVAG